MAEEIAIAPRTVVVATDNVHKVTEIAAALRESAAEVFKEVTFVRVKDLLSDYHDPLEDGLSFEENAAIKARTAHEATGLPALADDSGLMVDALDGAPGIYSARYAGEPTDDARNNAKLLAALEGCTPSERRARFVSCLVLVGFDALMPEQAPYITVTGTCEGAIADKVQGTAGFGYDPLFLPDATPGKHMAELSLEAKTAISHRGQALRKLIVVLSGTPTC